MMTDDYWSLIIGGMTFLLLSIATVNWLCLVKLLLLTWAVCCRSKVRQGSLSSCGQTEPWNLDTWRPRPVATVTSRPGSPPFLLLVCGNPRCLFLWGSGGRRGGGSPLFLWIKFVNSNTQLCSLFGFLFVEFTLKPASDAFNTIAHQGLWFYFKILHF